MKNISMVILVFAILVLGAACQKKTAVQNGATLNPSANTSNLTAADRAGLDLTGQKCRGTEKPQLTRLPMNLDDIGMILPYGLMIGGHVTPVDHQYFSPKIFDSKPDAYPIYAMADSHLVDISTRQHDGQGINKGTTITDYRLVFFISCRLLYYYDLVTSLAPGLQAAFDASGRDLTVTAGQLIGTVGGQTLDFAVWDMDKKLTGFVSPELYTGEAWKIYTADPLDYYSDQVKADALTKYVRTVEPRSGKIDYDLDGKLIGNWFQVGTDGYGGVRGEGAQEYWIGHLSVAPHYIDPTAFLISIGNWPGGASQFATVENAPDPAGVDQTTGLVKYSLTQYREMTSDGRLWDSLSLPTSALTLKRFGPVAGCFLVQLTGERTLKAEAFKDTVCASVSGFSSSAVMYER